MDLSRVDRLAHRSGSGLDISYRKDFDRCPVDPMRLCCNAAEWPWPWRVRLLWSKNERDHLRLAAYAPRLDQALKILEAELDLRARFEFADFSRPTELVYAAEGFKPRKDQLACLIAEGDKPGAIITPNERSPNG